MPALPSRFLAAALLCVGGAALPPLAAWAANAPAIDAAQVQRQRQTQREHIQAQRREIEAQRERGEAACYQQFAVEDCLRRVRVQAREADNVLHHQEVQINDAERREKAGQRLQAIEERKQEQRQKLEAGERPAPMRVAPRNAPQKPREQEARDRAQQQSRRAAEHAADVQRREQTQPQRIQDSRARYEAKQQKARERRERLERQQAEAAGRNPPTALPPPAPAASSDR